LPSLNNSLSQLYQLTSFLFLQLV